MKKHVIRKTALFFLGLFLLSISVFAEVYSTHFFTIDTDLDNLKFFLCYYFLKYLCILLLLT